MLQFLVASQHPLPSLRFGLWSQRLVHLLQADPACYLNLFPLLLYPGGDR